MNEQAKPKAFWVNLFGKYRPRCPGCVMYLAPELLADCNPMSDKEINNGLRCSGCNTLLAKAEVV